MEHKRPYQQQGHIEITKHAMMRLKERVQSYGDYQSW